MTRSPTNLIAVCVTLLSIPLQLLAFETQPREVFDRLLKNAQKGDAGLQLMVALAYDFGSWYEGIPQDETKACQWYRRAAEQGNATAQHELGLNYQSGRGVSEDRAEAAKWFRRSAEQGEASSQCALGYCCRDGDGVSQDLVEAYKWLNLALAQSTGSVERNGLKLQIARLINEMTPQQIALAQRHTTAFVPRRNQPANRKERDRGASESLKCTGSGFFISDDGSLVTNFHVVEGASRVVVKTKQGSFSAQVVKLDPVNDIAILKVAGSGFRPLALTPSRAAKLGESVFTIGFPNPGLQGVEPKLTDGKISSLTGALDDARHFQISVAVQPGNSGGALVNSVGNLVGIVTARLSDKAALETAGALPQNVNYAIKSSYVLSLLEALPELTGKLKEPWPARERKFEDVVKEAQEAAALILVY